MTQMGVPVEAVASSPTPEYGQQLDPQDLQKIHQGPQQAHQGPQLTPQGSPQTPLLLTSPRGPAVRRRSAPAGVAPLPQQDAGEQEDMET